MPGKVYRSATYDSLAARLIDAAIGLAIGLGVFFILLAVFGMWWLHG